MILTNFEITFILNTVEPSKLKFKISERLELQLFISVCTSSYWLKYFCLGLIIYTFLSIAKKNKKGLFSHELEPETCTRV